MMRPPRLVARTLTAAFVTVAAILSIVFIVLMVDARSRVRAAEIDKLRVAERVFTALEAEKLARLTRAADVEVLRLGALLHDIGKIGLSDDVLRKRGPLTAEEYEQLKRHPAVGARILRQVPFLAPHVPIVELHHERPDGRGYLFGLRGDDIPIAARIVHVADAYDAITSQRAYRPARDAVEAIAELRRYAGTQFDEASVVAVVVTQVSRAAEPAVGDLVGHSMV